jgi:hypothetical protein
VPCWNRVFLLPQSSIVPQEFLSCGKHIILDMSCRCSSKRGLAIAAMGSNVAVVGLAAANAESQCGCVAAVSSTVLCSCLQGITAMACCICDRRGIRPMASMHQLQNHMSQKHDRHLCDVCYSVRATNLIAIWTSVMPDTCTLYHGSDCEQEHDRKEHGQHAGGIHNQVWGCNLCSLSHTICQELWHLSFCSRKCIRVALPSCVLSPDIIFTGWGLEPRRWLDPERNFPSKALQCSVKATLRPTRGNN